MTDSESLTTEEASQSRAATKKKRWKRRQRKRPARGGINVRNDGTSGAQSDQESSKAHQPLPRSNTTESESRLRRHCLMRTSDNEAQEKQAMREAMELSAHEVNKSLANHMVAGMRPGASPVTSRWRGPSEQNTPNAQRYNVAESCETSPLIFPATPPIQKLIPSPGQQQTRLSPLQKPVRRHSLRRQSDENLEAKLAVIATLEAQEKQRQQLLDRTSSSSSSVDSEDTQKWIASTAPPSPVLSRKAFAFSLAGWVTAHFMCFKHAGSGRHSGIARLTYSLMLLWWYKFRSSIAEKSTVLDKPTLTVFAAAFYTYDALFLSKKSLAKGIQYLLVLLAVLDGRVSEKMIKLEGLTMLANTFTRLSDQPNFRVWAVIASFGRCWWGTKIFQTTRNLPSDFGKLVVVLQTLWFHRGATNVKRKKPTSFEERRFSFTDMPSGWTDGQASSAVTAPPLFGDS